MIYGSTVSRVFNKPTTDRCKKINFKLVKGTAKKKVTTSSPGNNTKLIFNTEVQFQIILVCNFSQKLV